MKKIIEVDYGISHTYDNVIEINRKLKGNLRNKILSHEKEHEKGKYTKKDYKIDFDSKNPYFFESVWFALRNPEALMNFFIFGFSIPGKFLTISLTNIYPFINFLIIWVLFFVFLFKISILGAILGYVFIYALLNITFIIYAYFYALNLKFSLLEPTL